MAGDGDLVLPTEFRAASATGRRLSRRSLILALMVVAIGVGSGWGWRWWTIGRFVESTDDAYVAGDITVIAPRVAGFVALVPVEDNQRVKAGDLLVRLDDRDYRARLKRAEAAAAMEQAMVANLEAKRALQEAEIGQARARIGATGAELARTAADAARYRKLFDRHAGSEQSFERADSDYKKALAADQVARAALLAAERQLAVIDTEKRQKLAALDQARADCDLALLDLGFTEIRAPVDGVVGNRGVRAGAYASPGTQLLSIVAADGLWIDANFKESQIAYMRPGQPVTIHADILPGKALTGLVESVAPATGARFSILPPENATGNFTKIVQRVPLRIRLDGDAARLGFLRPGLSVAVEVDLRDGGPMREP